MNTVIVFVVTSMALQCVIIVLFLFIIASYKRSLKNAEECINQLMRVIQGNSRTVDIADEEVQESLAKMFDKAEEKR